MNEQNQNLDSNDSVEYFDGKDKYYDPRLNRLLIHYKELYQTYNFIVGNGHFMDDIELYDKLCMNLANEIARVKDEFQGFYV